MPTKTLTRSGAARPLAVPAGFARTSLVPVAVLAGHLAIPAAVAGRWSLVGAVTGAAFLALLTLWAVGIADARPLARPAAQGLARAVLLGWIVAASVAGILALLAPSLPIPDQHQPVNIASLVFAAVTLSLAVAGARAVSAALAGPGALDLTEDRHRGDTPVIRAVQAAVTLCGCAALVSLAVIPAGWTGQTVLAAIALLSLATRLLIGGRVGYDSGARVRCVGADHEAHYIARGLQRVTNPDGTVMCEPCAAELTHRGEW